MNATKPAAAPRRRFPTDVTSPSFPNQYRGSSNPPQHEGQRQYPKPAAPKKGVEEPSHER